jgi:hypothetical protein
MENPVTAGEKGKGLWVAEEVTEELLVFTLTGPPVLDAVVVDSGEAPAVESPPLPDSVARAMAIGLTHGVGMRLLCQCCQSKWSLRADIVAEPEKWLRCDRCGPLNHARGPTQGKQRKAQQRNVAKGGAIVRGVPIDCPGPPHHRC